MQLNLVLDQKIYTPPKTQLLKWIGNKQKFANQITRHFPNNFNRFIEPFIGSGAIMATIAHHEGIGSDIFKPLIDIWKCLKSNPNELISWYSERRSLIDYKDKKKVYNEILKSYNENPNGADFLFLSRSCYGGVIRFRKSDGYMSTPCGAHTPIPIKSFIKRVDEWKYRVKGMNFNHMDYQDTFDLSKPGDLIYCDPPYSHTQSILYGAQDFSLVRLFEKIQEAKNRGVYIALSIDGKKKSGNLVCDIPIPAGLFEQELFIDCGKSMLNRFQKSGDLMINEQVYDRLLLTY